MTDTSLNASPKRKPTLWFAPLISAIVAAVITRIAYGAMLGSQISPDMQQAGMADAINNSIWMMTMFSAVGAAVLALVIVLIIRAVRA